MAAPADYHDTADLRAVGYGGLVNEEVMQRIWDISSIPLPFMDLVGWGEGVDDSAFDWTKDALQSPDVTNAVISGADASGNNAATGSRIRNQCQISDKVLEVTERAQETDQIGREDELAYQLMMRQQELFRDLEAIALYPQATVVDNNDDTAGKTGTFPSFVVTNDDLGSGGAATGFNSTTGICAAPTPGNGRALSIATIKNMIEGVFSSNGDIRAIMSRHEVMRRLNAYILANPTSFGIATPTANVRGEGAAVDQIAQGYISVAVTDFGFVCTLIPNRLQQTYSSGDATAISVCDMFGIDPDRVEYTALYRPRAKPIAKLGLADRWQLSTDWGLRVGNEEAHFVIRDLIPTGTITA